MFKQAHRSYAPGARRLRSALLRGALYGLLLFAAAVFLPAAHAREASGALVGLKFKDADIREVVEAISRILPINYLVDARVRGKTRFTMDMDAGIGQDRLLPLLETILDINKYAIVQAGDFYKIVRTRDARPEVNEIFIGRRTSADSAPDRLIIQIIPLKYISCHSDIYRLLKKFKSRRGYIRRYREGNLLVVFDRIAVIRKMLRIVAALDVDRFEQVRTQVFHLQRSDARSVAAELHRLCRAAGLGKSRKKHIGITFIPVMRVNAVVAISAIPGIFEKVAEWVRGLDDIDAVAEQQVHVHSVQHGKAADIAQVLRKIYIRNGRRSVRGRRGIRQQGDLLQGPVVITEDDATNSLVIRAAPADYALLAETIAQLDVFTQQVFIEVLIAEVHLQGDTEFGVEWALLGDKARVGGYTGQDSAEVDFGTGGLGTDPAQHLGRGAVYRFNSNRLEAFLVAQASRNKLAILSAPHILAADNQEARIEVGQEVPIVTREYAPADRNAGTAISRSVEYRSTGVMLTVTPRINTGGLVALEISQELSEAQPVVAGGIQSPVISDRKTQTTLAVGDNQTAVISGLTSETSGKRSNGVPFLARIPLLGYLFSNTKGSGDWKEIVLMITPHIINSPGDVDTITRSFRQKLIRIQQHAADDARRSG